MFVDHDRHGACLAHPLARLVRHDGTGILRHDAAHLGQKGGVIDDVLRIIIAVGIGIELNLRTHRLPHQGEHPAVFIEALAGFQLKSADTVIAGDASGFLGHDFRRLARQDPGYRYLLAAAQILPQWRAGGLGPQIPARRIDNGFGKRLFGYA